MSRRPQSGRRDAPHARLGHGRRPDRARAALGQHFLRDRGIAGWMVRRARVGPHDLVMDIGAGDGALTIPLAARAGAVVALECDPVLAERLRTRTHTRETVTVVQRDFLAWPLPRSAFTVVANLPFGITTAVLRRLLDPRAPIARAVLLIERGAARRFTRCPASDPEIITWHTWFALIWERHVSPSSFVPPPTVDAAAIVLERRPSPDLPPSGWMGIGRSWKAPWSTRRFRSSGPSSEFSRRRSWCAPFTRSNWTGRRPSRRSRRTGGGACI